jgi:hypothetical protein
MNFDPKKFMEQPLNEGSTSATPCPEGEWEAAIVPFSGDEDISFEEFTSNKNGKTYTKMTCMVEINDPEVTSVTGREPTRVRYQTFLDLTDSGSLDMGNGKNLGLNRLRDAVGLNKPGFRFPELIGKSLIVEVKHRVDERDSTRVYDEISKVRGL